MIDTDTDSAPNAGAATDAEHLRTSAAALVARRAQRAQSRLRVRALLDDLASEARRFLGAAFTVNDPVTGFPVALVVRSDERLPDDYEQQTPRPTTDTVSRLVVDVLGQVVSVEIDDAGTVRASGDTQGSSLDGVNEIRISGEHESTSAMLVSAADDAQKRTEIPFIRVLAELIDSAAQAEGRFSAGPDRSAAATAS